MECRSYKQIRGVPKWHFASPLPVIGLRKGQDQIKVLILRRNIFDTDMSKDVNFHVSSEIGRLRQVIVHRPDEGIARISPKRSSELLFDDIVHLPLMQQEHDIFRQVLECFVGSDKVYETRDLIHQSLENDADGREELIQLLMDFEELPRQYGDMLRDMEHRQLADVLITGYVREKDHILFDPIPNFIFTRDIAAMINDHVIITKASKYARHRENLLTRFIFWSHPKLNRLYREDKVINLNKVDDFPPSSKGEPVSIEGGDIMVLNEDYILIGTSERSTIHGFNSLKTHLLEKGIVRNVVQVTIPDERSFMHIDTIFTQINRDEAVAYKPIIMDGLSSYVEVYRDNGAYIEYPSLKEFLLSEISGSMNLIMAGQGQSPYQEREQWTDGCNLVAIKPGVALTYDRNPRTEIAFREAGYDIIHANELLRKVREESFDVEQMERTIICISSNELSRARGGTHCMTCPLERDLLE